MVIADLHPVLLQGGNQVQIHRALDPDENNVAAAQNVCVDHRLEFADRWVEAGVARWLSYKVISMQAAGQIPNHEASVTKGGALTVSKGGSGDVTKRWGDPSANWS